MALVLRQSTAKAVSFGPFVDKTDGVTPETGLVSALDHASTGILLSKNGGALTIRHAAVTASTYDAYGNYIVTLDTTDTNTVGTLRMQFIETATCLPVFQDFQVVEEAVFDALYAASAAGYQVPIWAAAGSTVNLSATTIATTQKVDVETIKTQAVTCAAGVTVPTSIASPTNITAGTITTVTNLTNAPTAGDFTATMKTSIGTAVAASAVASVTGNVGGNVAGSVASVTAGVTVTTNNDKTGYALSAAGSAAMTEGYAALGATATLPQLLYEVRALLAEKSISSTTLTTKKLDGSTQAATYTLNDATTPSAITRAS